MTTLLSMTHCTAIGIIICMNVLLTLWVTKLLKIPCLFVDIPLSISISQRKLEN